jgi:hypothetical protein
MDLFSLSHRIRHARYAVNPELVAEAILRWHQRYDYGVTPTVLEPEPREGADPEPPPPFGPF